MRKYLGVVLCGLLAAGLVLGAGTANAQSVTSAPPADETRKEAVTAATAEKAAAAQGTELQQMHELLQQQARELEQQRAMLREEQSRLAALEKELDRAKSASPAQEQTAASVGVTPNVAARVEKLEKDNADTKKSFESKLKSFGPFKFSGDLRLRDEPFFGGPVDQSQVRNRERFRLRVHATTKLNEQISGGFSLATGDINDPISTNQTANQFYTRKPLALDRAFINYQPKWVAPLTLTGGKFAYPWYRTELTWDNDLNPEGLAQTLAWDIKAVPALKHVALVGFELPFTEVAGVSTLNKSIVQSAVYGGQAQSVWQLTNWLKFSAYGGFYNYHNADPIALALATASAKNPQTPGVGTLPLGGTSVQNSMTVTTATNVVTIGGVAYPTGVKTITNAQFASKFGLLDAIARFEAKTPYERWPVTILGDFVQNTRACANVGNILPVPANSAKQTFARSTNAACDPRQRRGYWAEARFGRTQDAGDWQFAYTRMLIEREAVMGAFNFSDIRQASNVTQHRMEALYQAHKNVQLAFTGLFGRPLVTASSPTLEPILKRLQFDVVYKF